MLAFRKNAETVFIVINDTYSEKTVSFPDGGGFVKMIVTDEKSDLFESTVKNESIKISPRSVSTIIL